MSNQSNPLDGIAELNLSPDDAAVVIKLMSQAWEEGFQAGEQDVFEHEHTGDWDSECIKNPYKS